jgi:hypothetical protein
MALDPHHILRLTTDRIDKKVLCNRRRDTIALARLHMTRARRGGTTSFGEEEHVRPAPAATFRFLADHSNP